MFHIEKNFPKVLYNPYTIVIVGVDYRGGGAKRGRCGCDGDGALGAVALHDEHGFTIEGLALVVLEPFERRRRAVVDTGVEARAADIKRHLIVSQRAEVAEAVDNLHEHIAEVFAVGCNHGAVGGKAYGVRLAGCAYDFFGHHASVLPAHGAECAGLEGQTPRHVIFARLE